MSRLNLTLDADTAAALRKHAKGGSVAAAARRLIQDSLVRIQRVERLRKLAKDYAAQGKGEAALAEDFAAAQNDAWRDIGE